MAAFGGCVERGRFTVGEELLRVAEVVAGVVAGVVAV